jgi:hypothetical protein
MAKAKKTGSNKTEKKAAPKVMKKTTKSSASPKTTTKSAAVKVGGKKLAAKKLSPGSTGGGMPMIDTNLAAQTAAAMLANRDMVENANAPAKEESSTFKNLKEQLAKPKPTGLGGLFGPTGDQKKSGSQFNPNQQRGHNQTFGGFNKAGVPRRTNG